MNPRQLFLSHKTSQNDPSFYCSTKGNPIKLWLRCTAAQDKWADSPTIDCARFVIVINKFCVRWGYCHQPSLETKEHRHSSIATISSVTKVGNRSPCSKHRRREWLEQTLTFHNYIKITWTCRNISKFTTSMVNLQAPSTKIKSKRTHVRVLYVYIQTHIRRNSEITL